jgi:hypothetical protein
MSWLKGLTDSLGLTSTGPSAATLEQIKNAPIGTQSLGEQRVSSFDEDLQKAFKPLVRGWQPGQAPLTQDQYDRIQAASLDLFDKLGMTSPMGAQPSRVVAASMRKAVRPPPRSYAEAKTPAAQEVEFQHASPHKFSNADETNPYGKFDESHLLKGEGATRYGPGAAYVSTAEPTHRYYMKKFANSDAGTAAYDLRQLEKDFGLMPNLVRTQMASKVDLSDGKELLAFAQKATVPENLPPLLKQAAAENLAEARSWLERFVNSGTSFSKYKVERGPYSYRGTIAEDPTRTVLFDKPLSEQLPEVQAALARSSSQARKDIVPTSVESWGQQETRNLLHKHFYDKIVEAERAKFGETFDRAYGPALGKRWADFNTAEQGSWLQQLKPDWNKQQQELLRRVDAEAKRWNKNPKIAARLPGLDEHTSYLLQNRIDVPNKHVRQSTNTDKAGEYIEDYRASPKTVQRLRDAGIDLIKYGGSSESPNYVVVNPAAAKIRQRTPGIAATFGTGELARQLYESIYGKDAQ